MSMSAPIVLHKLAQMNANPSHLHVSHAIDLKSAMLRVESDVSIISSLAATASEVDFDEDLFFNEQMLYQEIELEEKLCSVSPNSAPLELGFELQILSDVHTEFLGNNAKRSQEFYSKLDELICPSAKYLALLGDIGCPGTPDGFIHFQEFVSRLEGKFEHIFIVPGNHEYYCRANQRMHMEEIKLRLRKYCERKGYVTFLDRSSAVLPICGSQHKVRLIGATLWSDISSDPKVESDIVNNLADFQNIFVSDSAWDPDRYCSLRSIQAEDIRKLHQDDLEFIVSEVAAASTLGESIIILTHHAPSFKGTSAEEYCSGAERSSKSHVFSTAFASELDHLFCSDDFQRSVRAWAYGHTHHSNRQIIEGIQVVSNQLGYLHKHEDCVCDKSCIIRI